MARRSSAEQGSTPSGSGRSSAGGPGGGPLQDLGWIPVALGAAAIVAGLGGRKKGAAALALTAVAGAGAVGAVGALRSAQSARGKASGEPEVERSITIGRTADELRQYWLDPGTLPQVMASFAAVRAAGDGRMHWKLEGPFGRAWEWETETVDWPGEGIGWRSLADAGIKNEGRVRFRPAPADRGTVVTLRIRFDPPGGALGEGLLKPLVTTPLAIVADTALRRFKNLVESGEIPTTARQPAARAHTH